MKDLKLLQIVPSLESGGVEQGTIDTANYIAEKNLQSILISNGGRLLSQLNRKNIKHIFEIYHQSMQSLTIQDYQINSN